MLVYLLLKVIHVAAVVIFLGNIITGLFWMAHAKRSKNLQLISHTMQGVIKSDRWFTIPGVIIITVGGIAAADYGNYPLLRTGWIFWSLVLFSLSGIAFMWKVAPLQKQIYKMTSDAANFSWPAFEKKYKEWELWGAIALLTPLAALVMMILKKPVSTFFLS